MLNEVNVLPQNDTQEGLDCHPFTSFRAGLSLLLVILSEAKNLLVIVKCIGFLCFSRRNYKEFFPPRSLRSLR